MADQRKALNDILFELANKQDRLKKVEIDTYVSRLKSIYRNRFRHWYSDVFSIVARAYQKNPDAIQTLLDNTKDIHEAVNPNEKSGKAMSEFELNIKKLYDHVNLDVTRIQYMQGQFAIWDKEHRRIEDQLMVLAEKAESMQRKAESMQKDYVTILGIFAAILITFVAGMTFSSSILNNIDKASIYRLTFVMLMIALMLFNLLHLLIDFIRKMQDRDRETRVEQSWFRSKVFIINSVLLLMVLIDFICWYFIG